MKKSSLNISYVVDRLYSLRTVLFMCGTIIVFAVVAFQVWQAINIEPSAATGSTTTTPKIDQATVDKIRTLQDSSVQVRSLFDEARRNPFEE